MSPARRRRCVVSWSGGKDSTMALQRARGAGLEVVGFLTMLSPETGTSRSHGLPPELLRAQAAGHGLPLHVAYAGWDDYEREFKGLLGRLVEQLGVEVAVFGDIFLDDHRAWVERVCGEVGCEAIEPLWGEDTAALAEAALAHGIEARICTVRSECLEHDWLGEPFDRAFLGHVAGRQLDPCGEHGEYHTVVVGAPDMGVRLLVDEAFVESSSSHGHWVIRRWRAQRPGAEALGGPDEPIPACTS